MLAKQIEVSRGTQQAKLAKQSKAKQNLFEARRHPSKARQTKQRKHSKAKQIKQSKAKQGKAQQSKAGKEKQSKA